MRRFALAAVLAIVGCAKTEVEQEPKPETPATPADDPTREQPAEQTKPVEIQIAARQPPEVTVLDPGAAPRDDLLLRPAAGTTEGIEIVTKTRMSMAGAAGKIPPTSVPPVVMKGRTIVERSDGKEIAFRHEIDAVKVRDDPEAPPGLVNTLREQLGAFDDYAAELRIDAKGGLLGGTVHMPAAAQGPVQQAITQMTESFGQIQVPLPREPVGVGAKWRAEVTIDQAGLKVQQTVDYSLTRRDGNALEIEATIRQELLDATFTPPGLLGVEAKVTRFQSTGTGTMQLDLQHLVPTRSEVEMKIDMHLDMMVSGQAQAQDMAMVVGVAFTRT